MMMSRFFEERRRSIIERLGGRQHVLSIIELDERHPRVSVDEGLLVSARIGSFARRRGSGRIGRALRMSSQELRQRQRGQGCRFGVIVGGNQCIDLIFVKDHNLANQ